jgi:uncharacterized membrane protein
MILPAWLIFAILQGLTSNAFNFFSRVILRGKDDATAFGWVMQLVRFVVFFLYAIFFDWRLVISIESISILLLLGITEAVSLYLYMKMHVHSELSISTILSRTRMLWVPLFAFLIIGEVLKPIEYVGIGILFLGVSIVSSPRKMFVDKGAMYANSAAIIIALNIVLYKVAMPYASDSLILASLGLPSIFILPLFMKDARKRIYTNIKLRLPLKLSTIGLNIISLIFFALAMQDGEASKVNAVYQGMMVFAVVAGIIFLNERNNIPKKIIGTTITVIGVIMLSLY